MTSAKAEAVAGVAAPVRSTILPLDHALEPVGPAGRIGLVAISTDFNSETELRRLIPEGVEIFTSRILNANPVTIPNLRAMAADIPRAATTILNGHPLDVMIYGCTTGTVAIGEAEIERLIQEARPGIPVTNPISALRAACRALGAKRVSLLTPYTRPVNDALAETLTGAGLEVLNVAGFGLDDDAAITGVPSAAILDAAPVALDPEAEVLFISCTGLRVVTILRELERRLDRPVVTSNQALLWHALRLIGYDRTVPDGGRLFTLPLAP